jgi:hypothetical protein
MTDGWVGAAQADPFALPRMYVAASLGADCFALRTAGLFCHCLGGR